MPECSYAGSARIKYPKGKEARGSLAVISSRRQGRKAWYSPARGWLQRGYHGYKLKTEPAQPTRIMQLAAELEEAQRAYDHWDGLHKYEDPGPVRMTPERYRNLRAYGMRDLAFWRSEAIIEMISVLQAESLADAAVQFMLASSIADTLEDEPCSEQYGRERKKRFDRLMGSALSFVEGRAGINLMEYGAKHYYGPWYNPMDPYNPAYESDWVEKPATEETAA